MVKQVVYRPTVHVLVGTLVVLKGTFYKVGHFEHTEQQDVAVPRDDEEMKENPATNRADGHLADPHYVHQVLVLVR